MNWKLRLKNKPVLIALIAAVVAFVYQILGLLGIVPSIAEEEVIKAAGFVVNILVLLGIVVDPTTSGVSDSARALTYKEPGKVTTPDDLFPMGGEGDGEDPHDDFMYPAEPEEEIEDYDEDDEDDEDIDEGGEDE